MRARACTALGEAFSNATGLWTKASQPTIQSRAFFITPVTPCAYSGLAMRSASADKICVRRFATGKGSVASMSGLNSGRSPRLRESTTLKSAGAKRATARSSAELREAARRLPEIARIFMMPTAKVTRRFGVLADKRSGWPPRQQCPCQGRRQYPYKPKGWHMATIGSMPNTRFGVVSAKPQIEPLCSVVVLIDHQVQPQTRAASLADSSYLYQYICSQALSLMRLSDV